MSIKNFFITLLLLWLYAWHCSAAISLETEGSNLLPPENGASNFSPFKGAVNKILPFENQGISEVLPPDVAFVFSSYMESPSILVASWQIAEGYYLYRDQFQFALKDGGVLGDAQFPQGQIKDDVKYGRVEVYKHQLEIKLPVSDSQGLDIFTLEASYQGCAEDRICYPPMEKTVVVNLLDTASSMPVAPEIILENQLNTDLLTTSNSTFDSAASLGEDADEFLDVEKAFVFSAEFPKSSFLVLRWKIAEGYYLYRDKMEFALESEGELGTPQFPPSILKKDEQFGDVEVYQQPLLEITVPIETEEAVTLSVKYQGCAIAGLCYPPMTKMVDLQIGGAMSEQDRLADLLANANVLYTIMMFFGLGLLLSLTPCVFPMIPILSSIIVGQGKEVTTYKAFIMSLTYVLAMAFTYAIVGVLTGLLGENLSAAFQNPWVLISFALIFVALSLSMFGFYDIQLPNALQTKLTSLSNRQQGGTLIGVAIMGILSALIVGPCVAAPLVGALIYIGQTGDAILGGLALFALSMGMGIPLIIIGISAGHFLPKAGVWMDNIKAVFGVMLLAVAIWMLERIIPGQVTMLLWGSLLIVSGVYLGALDKLGVSGWRKLWKSVGLILLVYGVLLMVGAASGNVNPLQPLHNMMAGKNSTQVASTPTSQFKPIKGVNGLEGELAAARNQPVMLDFYADWCISCKEMEHMTFADAEVQKILANFVLLQADVTPNDEQDKGLYKHFGIFGPPAILFFDTNGQELGAYRVVGFMPADEFRQHLKKVIQPL